MYEANEYLKSSEKLVAFLDGELPQEETAGLFYELAQNSELQEQMKQFVNLRNNMDKSQVMPPLHLKNNLLRSTGLKEGPLDAFLDASSKVAAILVAMFYNKASLSVLLISALSVGAILMMNRNVEETAVANAASEQAVKNSASNSIAFMESIDVTSEDLNNSLTLNKSDDDIAIAKTVRISSTNFAKNNSGEKTSANLLSATHTEFPEINNQNNNDFIAHNILPSNFVVAEIPFGINSYPPSKRHIFAESDLLADIMQNTTFYVRYFGSRSYPDFQLQNESNPLLNDIRAGFKYNLSGNHSVGVAIGMENFLMSFNKETDGIIYRYDQSWNTGWLAFTYNYNFGEIASGLHPEVNVLLGSTVVGPLARIGAGVNYFVTESFYLNLGFETGSLIFRERNQKGGYDWFTTDKAGLIFGFGIGL